MFFQRFWKKIRSIIKIFRCPFCSHRKFQQNKYTTTMASTRADKLYRRRRADQQESAAAAPTNCRRRRGAAGHVSTCSSSFPVLHMSSCYGIHFLQQYFPLCDWRAAALTRIPYRATFQIHRQLKQKLFFPLFPLSIIQNYWLECHHTSIQCFLTTYRVSKYRCPCVAGDGSVGHLDLSSEYCDGPATGAN